MQTSTREKLKNRRENVWRERIINVQICTQWWRKNKMIRLNWAIFLGISIFELYWYEYMGERERERKQTNEKIYLRVKTIARIITKTRITTATIPIIIIRINFFNEKKNRKKERREWLFSRAYVYRAMPLVSSARIVLCLSWWSCSRCNCNGSLCSAINREIDDNN